MRVSCSPHCCQHFFSCLGELSHYSSGKMKSESCFNFTSLIIKDVAQFSKIFLGHLISSFENSLFRPTAHFFFKVGSFVFLTLFLVPLIFLIINPLSDIELGKILSLSVGFLFTWMIVSFTVQKWNCCGPYGNNIG